MVILAVAVAIGFRTALVNSSAVYALLLVWAVWEIFSRHLAVTEWIQEFSSLILSVGILLPAPGIGSAVTIVRWLRESTAPLATTSLRKSQPCRVTAKCFDAICRVLATRGESEHMCAVVFLGMIRPWLVDVSVPPCRATSSPSSLRSNRIRMSGRMRLETR